MIARTSYSGEDGFEVFVKNNAIHIWNHLISDGALPVGFDAIDIARIEAGLLFLDDMTGFETQLNLGSTLLLMARKKIFVANLLQKSQIPRHKIAGLTIDGLNFARKHPIVCGQVAQNN